MVIPTDPIELREWMCHLPEDPEELKEWIRMAYENQPKLVLYDFLDEVKK